MLGVANFLSKDRRDQRRVNDNGRDGDGGCFGCCLLLKFGAPAPCHFALTRPDFTKDSLVDLSLSDLFVGSRS
jgi:hypothetical protein